MSSSVLLKSKLLAAMMMLLSLKGIIRGYIIGSSLVVCLFFYSMLIDALYEVTSHIGALWMQSDAITRFLMLCLAVCVVKMFYPYASLLIKKGV